MYRKIFFVNIFLVLGIIIGNYFSEDLLKIIIIATLMYILVYAVGNHFKQNFFSKSSIFIIFGIILNIYSTNSSILQILGDNVELVGTIEKIEKTIDGKNKYKIKCSGINGKLIKNRNNILMTTERGEDFRLGQTLIFTTKLEKPKIYKNPMMFNYSNYLLSHKIYAVGYTKNMKLLDENRKFKYVIRESFRKRVENTFEVGLFEKNKNLIKSIILGENYLSKDDRDNYRDLGLAHILAVSGLHIGIIAKFIEIVLRKLKINRDTIRIFIIIFIWLYGFAINFPISIVRANIMLSTYFISQNFKLPYDYKNSIFTAMIIILILNPNAIYSQSFILSFAAVLSLAYINPFIEIKIRSILGEYSKIVAPIISVNIGLLPILAYYFNSIQIISLISNLIIVPLITIALNLATINIALNGVYIINKIINILLYVEDNLLLALKHISFGQIEIYSPSIKEIIMYYIIIFCIINNKKFKRIFFVYRKVMIFGIFYIIVSMIYENVYLDTLKINFIDVGQGDCILLRYKSKNYMIDTGGEVFEDYSIGENIVVPYLVKNNIKDLEILFISHFHEDHSKAGINICEKRNVKNIFSSYIPDESYIYSGIKKYNRVYILNRGDNIRISKNLKFNIISPAYDDFVKVKDENNSSMVIKLEYKGMEILFSGDIEQDIENKLIDNKDIKDMFILKVPHHGSKTSSTEKFIEYVNPKIAIFTVGERNRFNHPHDEVLNRYNDKKIKIYRTDLDGNIEMNIIKDKLNIKTYREVNSMKYGDIIYYFFYTLILLQYFKIEKFDININ